jgi:hypothetical protein
MSAQKAEQIYDAKQDLRKSTDYVMKLEVQQTADEVMGLPKNADLDERISAARARCDEREAKIAQMESDYRDWLGDSA